MYAQKCAYMIVPTPAPTPDARADDIFARARVAIAAREYPSTIKYAIRISGYRSGAWSGRTYTAFEEWPDHAVIARSISQEEIANPYKPTGAGFKFFGFGSPGSQSGGAQGPNILGFPELAVTYAFGLDARGSNVVAATGPSDGSLRTIGTVRAVARTYAVNLAGEETVDGSACYHLRLRPLGNPGTYRLRDLWVDESSYQTRRLVTDGNFTIAETGKGPWTVSYVQSDGVWYLASEVSQGSVAGYAYVAVQFVNPVADPRENLDFGLAGSDVDDAVVEPPDPPAQERHGARP